jgi:phage gp16-like protein
MRDDAVRRRKSIAAIQIARQQLHMEEDTYRDMLERVSAQHGKAVRSAAKLTDRQRQAVLDELRRKGAKQPGAQKPANYPGKPHNFNSSAMPEMITKIEAQLADMGLSWAYADAIAKRQCGVPRVAWVRSEAQLKGIIAALDVEQRKRGANVFIDEAVKRLGIDDKQFAELTGRLPTNWRRNLNLLKPVCNYLHAQIDMLDQREQQADGGAG